MFSRRDVWALGSGWLAAAGLMTRSAVAHSKYPEHRIRLVVPFAVGGAVDTLGRGWADEMKTWLGPLFIENQDNTIPKLDSAFYDPGFSTIGIPRFMQRGDSART